MIGSKINFVAGVMRKNSASRKGRTPDHSLSDAMSDLQNESTDENINTRKRKQGRLCGGSGHDRHNCPRKKVEGVEDGAADIKKMMQCRIQLYWKMSATPHHSMLSMPSPMTITTKTHAKLRFGAIPHH